jgi:DNA adenine methylase
MMTYDDVPEIEALYQGLPIYKTSLLYSAQTKRKGTELLITDKTLVMPTTEADAAIFNT